MGRHKQPSKPKSAGKTNSCSKTIKSKRNRTKPSISKTTRSRCYSRSVSRSESESSNIPPEKPRSTAWENIVIHYLQKLKNYWYSGGNKLNKYSKNNESLANFHCTTESFEMPAVPCTTRKAHNIVRNALDYGLANGIVTRCGNNYRLVDEIKTDRYHLRNKRVGRPPNISNFTIRNNFNKLKVNPNFKNKKKSTKKTIAKPRARQLNPGTFFNFNNFNPMNKRIPNRRKAGWNTFNRKQCDSIFDSLNN